MGMIRLALCFAFAGSLVLACAAGSEKTGSGGSSGSGGAGGSGGSGNCGASVVCNASLSYSTCTSKSGACLYKELSTGAHVSCTSDPCTASPDGGGGTSGSGGTTGSGGSGGAGGSGGTPEAGSSCDSDPDAETCAVCCEGLYMAGAKTFIQAVGNCVCTSPGTCASECGSNFCAGMSASSACATCINSALAMSGACNSPVSTACGADPSCISFNNCANGCP